jgi:hypothetical protein
MRNGPRVARREFQDLDSALAALREGAVAVVREGPLEPVHGFREYEASEQVAARLAVSSGRFFGGRTAGVDVMGDGRLVPYAGAIRRRELEGRTPDAALDAVREALA